MLINELLLHNDELSSLSALVVEAFLNKIFAHFSVYPIQSCIMPKNRHQKVRMGDRLNIKSMLHSY